MRYDPVALRNAICSAGKLLIDNSEKIVGDTDYLSDFSILIDFKALMPNVISTKIDFRRDEEMVVMTDE